eukprot:7079776-Lingulodinium_polyedra.AAC.1
MGPHGLAPGTNAQRPAPSTGGAAVGRCWLRPRPAQSVRRSEPSEAPDAARNGHCCGQQDG